VDAQDRIIWAQTAKGTRIGTAFDRIPALRGKALLAELRESRWLAEWYAQQARAIGFDFHPQVRGQVEPEINHGRWIVRCTCGGAEEAAWQEPVFFCLSCGSIDNDSYLQEVKFPATRDREAIEQQLLLRAMENRNWLPGESALDLVHEFEAHMAPKTEATKIVIAPVEQTIKPKRASRRRVKRS
jgi:hypothetical protein